MAPQRSAATKAATAGRRLRRKVAGASGGFPHLMSPGRIGALRLPNRVVMAAMDMNLCHDGFIDELEVEHFAKRARGGTALVTTGAASVAYPAGSTSMQQPGLSDDKFLPGLRLLADGVHNAGGLVCIQLVHHGKTGAVDTAQGRPLLVPSVPMPKLDMSPMVDATREELMGLGAASGHKRAAYKEATEEDLAEVIAAFADAAKRCVEAGIDALELHAGHGYLISTFLSAGYNKRTDRWGGSLENRARLACETVKAIRAVVPEGYPLIVKFNGAEFMLENGLTDDEVVATARMLEAAGADAIHVSGYSNDPFKGFTLGPLPAGVAAYREITGKVKKAVSIPVIAVGRMLPDVAEEMLAAGECDFVAEGRWLLTDPELVNKLGSGRRDEVRPCINCFICAEQNFYDKTPVCAVNATLHDPAAPPPQPTDTARRVVIIGGGPAGMETARVAAQRGHDVTLVEAEDHLGGTAWFSQLTTESNGPFVDWLVHQLDLEGVTVRTGVRASVETVRSMRPDVVVVATGAHHGLPDIPGTNLPHVRSGDDLRSLITGESGPGHPAPKRSFLERILVPLGRLFRLTATPQRVRKASKLWMPVGKEVVVLGGGLVGLELAVFLSERKRQVTVLEAGPALALQMSLPRRLATVAEAKSHQVRLVRNATPVEITATSVTYEVEGERKSVPAQTVLVASEITPDNTLTDSLRDAGFDVRTVGDAGDVGYIFGAVHSGYQAGLDL